MPHKCSVVNCRTGYINGPGNQCSHSLAILTSDKDGLNFLTVKIILLLHRHEYVSITSNLNTFYNILTKLDSTCQ